MTFPALFAEPPIAAPVVLSVEEFFEREAAEFPLSAESILGDRGPDGSGAERSGWLLGARRNS